MTDFGRFFGDGDAASARSRSASVTPATPNPPTRRNSRRERPPFGARWWWSNVSMGNQRMSIG